MSMINAGAKHQHYPPQQMLILLTLRSKFEFSFVAPIHFLKK